MLIDALVEVVEHEPGFRDQPRRLSVIRGGLQFVKCRPHVAQRVFDRGERIKVDMPIDQAKAVDVDPVESVGHRRGADRAGRTHVDDCIAVLGENGHE